MIGLFGATGFTGQLVAKELSRKKLPFFLAGRSRHKLQELQGKLSPPPPLHLASVEDPQSLLELTQKCQVLINCVGPFALYGLPVLKACLESGCHYADITGEGPFIEEARVFDEPARKKHCTFVPALAYEIALSNFATALLHQKMPGAERVDIVYLNPSFQASQGTKRSLLLYLKSAPLTSLKRVQVNIQRVGSFPALSFPTADVAGAQQIVPGAQVRCLFTLPAPLASIFPYLAPLLPYLPHRKLEALALRGPAGPPEAVRKRQRFTLWIQIAKGREKKNLLLKGTSPYDLTAAIVVHGAELLLRKGRRRRGVLAPAQAFSPSPFLAYLKKERGLETQLRSLPRRL